MFGITLFMLGFGASIPFSGLLIIGSILGSTDPIAVSALLKELGTPEKINMIIEGESLLNDGVSLVLFEIFKKYFLGHQLSLFRNIKDLVTLCIGGPLFGVVVGLVFHIWMGRIIKDGVLVVSLTFTSCLLVFFFCEYPSWQLSGILALVTNSIILSYKSKVNIIADDLHHVVETIWRFLQFIAESVLFTITGIFVGRELRFALYSPESSFKTGHYIGIIIFFILMNLERFVIILMATPLFNKNIRKNEIRIGWKESTIISYAGIRGAFPLIICLTILQSTQFSQHYKNVVSVITVSVIFLGIVFNGITIKLLIKQLNIIKKNKISAGIKKGIRQKLASLSSQKYKSVKSKYNALAVNWSVVKHMIELDNEKNNLLSIERASFQFNTLDRGTLINMSSSKSLMIEVRIRTIYLFKSQILSGLSEMAFSSESALDLIEACNWALEEADSRLTIWQQLEELISNNISMKVVRLFQNSRFLAKHFTRQFNIEKAREYELATVFISLCSKFCENKDEFFSLPKEPLTAIIREIEEAKNLAEDFIYKMTTENPIVIRLYQTKRVVRELINDKLNNIKTMIKEGVLTEEVGLTGE